jgi:nucleotide-binding universal stress UspA family protein
MLAVQTILHPTDFSEQSAAAFGLACALARDYNARLILLHVAAPPLVAYGEGVFPLGIEDVRDEAIQKLARLEPGAGFRTERRVEEGDAVGGILHVAAETHADLIVLGTHGRTGLARLLMGSVAEQVVRKAPCPVMTVKTPFATQATSQAAAQAEAQPAQEKTP